MRFTYTRPAFSAARQLLQVLVEPNSYLLVVELHHLHTLAPHEATLLVRRQVLLRHNRPDGAILHKHNRVAQTLVLDLQRQTHQERPVLAPHHQLLQRRLRALLQVRVARRRKKWRPAQRARGENSKQSLTALRRLQLADYPLEILLGSVRTHIVLNNMYIHRCLYYIFFIF